jgi:transcriptional regulator with XRE-family HTH domain
LVLSVEEKRKNAEIAERSGDSSHQETTEMPSLGEVITRERDSKGWSQRELARRADVTDAWLAKVENGEIRAPGAIRLERLAIQLGLKLSDLLSLVKGDMGEVEPGSITQALNVGRQMLQAINEATVEIPMYTTPPPARPTQYIYLPRVGQLGEHSQHLEAHYISDLKLAPFAMTGDIVVVFRGMPIDEGDLACAVKNSALVIGTYHTEAQHGASIIGPGGQTLLNDGELRGPVVYKISVVKPLPGVAAPVVDVGVGI